MKWTAENIRQDFPALNQTVKGKPLVYLDSGASTLKSKIVIDEVNKYYLNEGTNVHRGAHSLSDIATEKFENARRVIAQFINARSDNEIIFTSGTTDAINLVAQSLSQKSLKPGDNIVITEMDHHSNIVPWQQVAHLYGAEIRYIPVNTKGLLDLSNLAEIINENTKMVAFNYISNAIGCTNPVNEILSQAKKMGAKTLIDCAQAMAVEKIDVQKLGCDFIAFSGHKLFAPSGIGVLYGKEDLLNQMHPIKFGGSMIEKVTIAQSTFLKAPQRFEAGTPHTAGAIGLGKAIELISEFGVENIYQHEKKLLNIGYDLLSEIDGINIYGCKQNNVNVLSFNITGFHPSDIGHLLDQQGVAVRTGHHCCQPLMQKLGIQGTVRASLSIYNNTEDMINFVNSLKKCLEFL